MLYVNVYLVASVWYSPAEGGCYFDQGTPLASIPVDSDYKKGQYYFLSNGIQIGKCPYCDGTGEVAVDSPADSEEIRMDTCQECGLIPDDPVATWNLIEKYQEYFKDEPGRYEHIRVALEDHFAASYPTERPTYE